MKILSGGAKLGIWTEDGFFSTRLFLENVSREEGWHGANLVLQQKY